jgi:hypothetical protein
MKQFAAQIYAAVKSGKLAQPFSSEMVKRTCPGWAERTYSVFLNKHRVGNPGGETELFVRVAPGLFKLRNSN